MNNIANCTKVIGLENLLDKYLDDIWEGNDTELKEKPRIVLDNGEWVQEVIQLQILSSGDYMNVYVYPDGYDILSYFKFSDFEDSIIDLEGWGENIKDELERNLEQYN